MYLRRLMIVICLTLVLIVAFPLITKAQESAAIQALATVVSSLHITGMNNLNFGTVTLGINKSVDKSTIGLAGEWEITGNPTAEITLDFTLPNRLLTADSSALMNIMFSSTDASYEDGTGGGQQAPVGVINPNGPNTLDIGAGGNMAVWIGGTVQPSISQTAGDYSADVVLSVAYTGN